MPMSADERESFQHVVNYLSQTESVISSLKIFPRNIETSAFDSIALEFISKGFALAKAITLLIENGFPDEAYGLSRSLVECSAALRYLTSEPDRKDKRALEFISFSETEQRYWLEQARQHLSDPKMLKEIEDYAAKQQLDTRRPKPLAALGHWSDFGSSFVWKVVQINHPLDGPTFSLDHRKIAWAVDYHGTSQYVHCSDRGIMNYFHDPARIYMGPQHGNVRDNTLPKALFIACVYLHEILCYSLFGLNTDRPTELNELFSMVIATPVGKAS